MSDTILLRSHCLFCRAAATCILGASSALGRRVSRMTPNQLEHLRRAPEVAGVEVKSRGYRQGAAKIVSCFSRTEPQDGSDPIEFVMCATSSTASGFSTAGSGSRRTPCSQPSHSSSLFDPAASRHRQMSMFIVLTDKPGFEIMRNVANYGEPPGEGTYVRCTEVHLPEETCSGSVAQVSWSLERGWAAGGSIVR